MNSSQRFRQARAAGLRQNPAGFVLLAILVGWSAIWQAEAAANVVVWDTGSPFADALELEPGTAWKSVPSDLLTLEADPLKATSDPGYYGREYSFQGDAVVENRSLAAVFWSAKGRVVIYPKANAAPSSGGSPPNTTPGRKLVELVPLQTKTRPMTISHCSILRNASDEVIVAVSFTARNAPVMSAVLSFDKTEVVAIRPGENMEGISLLSPMAYGVVPGFVADDLILGPAEYSSVNALCVPSENVFLGLLQGEDGLLAMTWPDGKQQVQLTLGKEPQGTRRIESIDFLNDGKSIYVATLRAPGIWHREELKPSYLEKDVTIPWRRPFPAKWKTQLNEADVRTTYAFRDTPAEIWRGVPGSYPYPVWFAGDNAVFHLSKKVPPKGEALIYAVEGKDTPASVSTPVDILKATLGRQMCDTLLDPAGRNLRTHHRRGAAGVRRACTCGCTEAIQAVFEARQEVERKEEINGAVNDMIYFVQRHVARIDEYRRFADEIIKLLRAHVSSAPKLKPFLENLEQIAQQIPQAYSVQKENMKSLAYADELGHRTLALTGKADSHNLAAYKELLDAWRAMGGAQDGVLAQCHLITRKLSQEAGYGCVNQREAVELAQEIRKRCRQCLRNPDGYEIWPDY